MTSTSMKTNLLWIVGGKIDFLAVKHSRQGGAFLFGTSRMDVEATWDHDGKKEFYLSQIKFFEKLYFSGL